jgi:hypothetical protein
MKNDMLLEIIKTKLGDFYFMKFIFFKEKIFQYNLFN